MIPELGHFALALACAFAFAQFILPIWGAHRRDLRLIAAAPGLACGQLLALGVSAGCLVWSHVVDDFSVLNVAENSNSLKPLIYKITGNLGQSRGLHHPLGADPGAVRRGRRRVRAQPARRTAGAGHRRTRGHLCRVPALLAVDVQPVHPAGPTRRSMATT